MDLIPGRYLSTHPGLGQSPIRCLVRFSARLVPYAPNHRERLRHRERPRVLRHCCTTSIAAARYVRNLAVVFRRVRQNSLSVVVHSPIFLQTRPSGLAGWFFRTSNFCGRRKSTPRFIASVLSGISRLYSPEGPTASDPVSGDRQWIASSYSTKTWLGQQDSNLYCAYALGG